MNLLCSQGNGAEMVLSLRLGHILLNALHAQSSVTVVPPLQTEDQQFVALLFWSRDLEGAQSVMGVQGLGEEGQE